MAGEGAGRERAGEGMEDEAGSREAMGALGGCGCRSLGEEGRTAAARALHSCLYRERLKKRPRMLFSCPPAMSESQGICSGILRTQLELRVESSLESTLHNRFESLGCDGVSRPVFLRD